MFIFHIRKQVICNIRTFQIYSVPSFSHHSQTTFHLPLKAHKNIFTKIKIGPPDQLLICRATSASECGSERRAKVCGLSQRKVPGREKIDITEENG